MPKPKLILFSAFSGLVIALCFPKFNLYYLAWIGIVPLLYAIDRSKKPFLIGFTYGAVFFLINLAWLNTLWNYVGLWAELGYLLLVIFEALFFGLAALLIKYIFEKFPNASFILVPFSWSFIDWLRSLTELGLTAGDIGYTQINLVPFIQIAYYVSVHGITFIIVLINLLIFFSISYIFEKKHKSAAINVLFFIIFLSFLSYFGYKELAKTQSQSKNLTRIAVIQGNVPQKLKLHPPSIYAGLNHHLELSKKAKFAKPDIIIWTETAVTHYLDRNYYSKNLLRELAKDSGAYLIIGTPSTDHRGTMYNSLMAFSPAGSVIGKYNKQHPIPFGEYLPFRQLLYPILQGIKYYKYDYTGYSIPSLLRVKNLTIGPLICFESTLPYLAKDRIKRGANILLTVTNDAWFLDSAALDLHFLMGRMRAVENRKYFIQAANTGISGIVDPEGRILKRSRINQTEILTFEVPLP